MGAVSKEQTTKNLGTNIAYFAINIAIGIFLTPYYIETLGIAAYAIIPLATSLIGYIGILTNSLNSAVSRHLVIDLQRSDAKRANQTFNSALFGITKIIVLLAPFVIIISFFAPTPFGVSTEFAIDATWLFIGIGLAFLIRAWSSSFTVTLYASNRLDLINFINLINIIVQVASIIIIFTFSAPSLAGIGVSYLLSAIIATLVSIYFYRLKHENLSIKYGDYDASRFREIAQMGGWMVINEVGSLLLINVDLIIVNYLFGNIVGGGYAISYQWVGLLRGMAGTFISILGPIIIIAYANKQRDRIIEYSKSAVKLTGIGIALPIGLLCGFAPVVLTVWVGEEYAYLAPLMVLLTSHLVVNTAVIPLFQINVAHNRVRLPAIVTFIMGFLNIVLAIALAAPLGWGVYGIAAAGLICLTFKNLIFTPIYASRVLEIPRGTFYPPILSGAIAAFVIAVLSILASELFRISSVIALVVAGGVLSLAYIFVAWRALLNETERSLIPLRRGMQ